MRSTSRFRPNLESNLLKAGLLISAVTFTALAQAQSYSWPYNTGSSVAYTPQQVSNLNFKSVKSGLYHTVALTADGKIYTWGSSNSKGQLGRSGTVNVPTLVNYWNDHHDHHCSTPVFVKIAASDYAGYAIDTHNDLYYWGTVAGSTVKTTPTRLWYDAISDIYDIAAGGDHGIIYGKVGHVNDVYSFGDNTYGQSGRNPDGNKSSIWFPYEISTALTGSSEPVIKSMSVSRDHSVVVLSSGKVRVFGKNTSGQLGVGTMSPTTGAPYYSVIVTAKHADGSDFLNGVEAAAGNDFSLVRDSSGNVQSAGNNGYNQTGRSGDQTRFGVIPGLAGATAISAGYNYAMASATGGVFEWGFRPTSNTTSTTAGPVLIAGVLSATSIDAGGAPVSTTAPFDPNYASNGGGAHTLGGATLVAAPVYLKTELWYEGERAGQKFTGGSGGFVRVYTATPAAAGNGPTFTLSTTSSHISFGGAAKVLDGMDYVDVPVTTTPVSVDDAATFDVASTTNPTVTGKKLTVTTPWADSLTLENVTTPGARVKGLNTVRFTVHLKYPAPAEGYTVPFTSSIPGTIASGGIPVGGGGQDASLEITAGVVEANDTDTVTITNSGKPDTLQRIDLGIAEIIDISKNKANVYGGTDCIATVVLDSPPPTAGLNCELGTSNSGWAWFDPTTVVLTSQTTDFAAHTAPVAGDKTVNLRARVNGKVVRSPLGVLGADVRFIEASNKFPRGGKTIQITGTFGSDLPAGGVDVTLTSSDPSVAAFVLGTYHATTGTFSVDVNTFAVTAPTQVTLTMTANGRTKDILITVRP